MRDQGSGVRGQGSGVRGQGSGVRVQGSGVAVPPPPFTLFTWSVHTEGFRGFGLGTLFVCERGLECDSSSSEFLLRSKNVSIVERAARNQIGTGLAKPCRRNVQRF